MPVYVTTSDLIETYGPDEMKQASNLREAGGGINKKRLEAACKRASGTVYGYLILRFSEPDIAAFSPDFLETLKQHAIAIARFYVDDGLEDVEKKANLSLEWLKRITDPRLSGGSTAKPDVTTDETPSQSLGYRIRPPTWKTDRLRDIGLD